MQIANCEQLIQTLEGYKPAIYCAEIKKPLQFVTGNLSQIWKNISDHSWQKHLRQIRNGKMIANDLLWQQWNTENHWNIIVTISRSIMKINKENQSFKKILVIKIKFQSNQKWYLWKMYIWCFSWNAQINKEN